MALKVDQSSIQRDFEDNERQCNLGRKHKKKKRDEEDDDNGGGSGHCSLSVNIPGNSVKISLDHRRDDSVATPLVKIGLKIPGLKDGSPSEKSERHKYELNPLRISPINLTGLTLRLTTTPLPPMTLEIKDENEEKSRDSKPFIEMGSNQPTPFCKMMGCRHVLSPRESSAITPLDGEENPDDFIDWPSGNEKDKEKFQVFYVIHDKISFWEKDLCAIGEIPDGNTPAKP